MVGQNKLKKGRYKSMKNYKKIKGSINKFYKAKIKEYRTSARVWVGRENIENPTKEQREKAIKELKKALARDLAHLEKVAAAPVLRSVSVVTEWVNNRTWGHNPHAFATIETAEGCERTDFLRFYKAERKRRTAPRLSCTFAEGLPNF